MIDISQFQSVVDEGFDQQLVNNAKSVEADLCSIFLRVNDARIAREALGDMMPNEHINVRFRLMEQKAAPYIASFTTNLMYMPLYGAKIRITPYKLVAQRKLQPLTPMDINEGECALIDSSMHYYSVDILQTGMVFEATDKQGKSILEIYHPQTFEHLSTIPANKKIECVYRACDYLSRTNSDEAKEMLHDLALNSNDMVRWRAAKAYCSSAGDNEAVALLKVMSVNDSNPQIKQLASATLKRNGV